MKDPEQSLNQAFDEKMNFYAANALGNNVDNDNMPAIISYDRRIYQTLHWSL